MVNLDQVLAQIKELSECEEFEDLVWHVDVGQSAVTVQCDLPISDTLYLRRTYSITPTLMTNTTLKEMSKMFIRGARGLIQQASMLPQSPDDEG